GVQAVSRNVGFEPELPAPAPAQQTAASLAALQSLATVQPAAAVETPQVQPEPVALVEPQPAPTPEVQQQATQSQISPTSNPAAFFGAAQANLAAASCAEDLRALTRQARVYFPSGGLTGESGGIEQARVIGLIAQECPGVTIRVEGHSDPSGNSVVNQRLSQQRAEAIISRIAAAGIDTTRFIAKGMGDTHPSTVNGPQSRAYYDRRVEFSVVLNNRTASLGSTFLSNQFRASACADELQRAVEQTKVFYAPGSVSVSQQDMNVASRLASMASSCPDARLRVIGQHSDMPGSGENPGTGRLRAVVLMSSLVSAGYDAQQIIIAAPSKSIRFADQPNLSDHRIDFDVIREAR
ncbi:MAG: OmpA family protein, partial [Pseudomonadota bacterium]